MNGRELEHMADLRMLAVLADTRSFTAAARQLEISKSLVSQRMKALEQALGVALLVRTTRSVRLTDAGARLVERSRPALETLRDCVSEARDLARAPRGRIRLTAPVALGRQHLTPVLAQLAGAYADIQIEVYLTDRFVNLRQEGFDFAIRHADQIADSYVARRLCATQAYLVAGPAYLARHGEPSHPSELASHRCLLYRGDELRSQWSFVPRGGRGRVAHVAPAETASVNNSELLRDMAAAGMGIAMAPDFSLPADGSLRRVLPDWDCHGGFARALYLVKPFSAARTQAHRLVEKALLGHFRKGFGQGDTL